MKPGAGTVCLEDRMSRYAMWTRHMMVDLVTREVFEVKEVGDHFVRVDTGEAIDRLSVETLRSGLKQWADRARRHLKKHF